MGVGTSEEGRQMIFTEEVYESQVKGRDDDGQKDDQQKCGEDSKTSFKICNRYL